MELENQLSNLTGIKIWTKSSALNVGFDLLQPVFVLLLSFDM